MIEGISHLTFVVKDLDKSAKIFQMLAAKEVYSSNEQFFSLSKEKFFVLGRLWLCLMEGEPCQKSYNHVAFKIEEEDYDKYLEAINNLGLELKPQRPRINGEGRSIYFYDYDGHLFELHTGTLEQRIESYRKVSSK